MEASAAHTSSGHCLSQSQSLTERTLQPDMWAKILLGVLFLVMAGAAFYIDPARDRSLLGVQPSDGVRLRLMTWNIGRASLERDSRARDEDLKAVAEVILKYDP